MQPNRLLHEKSPYLRQHAYNPVDWYPWGDAAFEKARAENKPIFLSIGYSTCHWCHVMEHESFENPAIAEIMNRWFVSIKVDREERPDIDRIYMNYVQAATGSGGWPMSVWLTPDLMPIIGGTYFPPENRYGRAGFPMVLERIAAAWKEENSKIVEQSAKVMLQLRAQAEVSQRGPSHVETSVMDSAFFQLRRSFDKSLGGFGGAPKFPRPSNYAFLLRYFKRTENDEALDMVAQTLIAMDRGGMNDQLGGGFHRYSVDAHWFVPHFEKMLYDQAQLVTAYLETFQITQDPVFANAARKVLEYVLRDMREPEGAFWSAEDADSLLEGEFTEPGHPGKKGEGAFYIWSWKETEALLGEQRMPWFAWRYGMESGGNVEADPHQEFTGRNILFAAHSVEDTAHHFGVSEEEMMTSLAKCERILLDARSKRTRPHLDDKILTAWNGLMISAFAKAGAILDEPRYTEASVRAADFILTTLRREDGTLLRRYRDGDAAIDGMLDDYTFFAAALLDLYETTFEFRWLEAAIRVTAKQRELFEDNEDGAFYDSAHADAAKLMRLKEDHDGAEPTGNSVALMNLLRLARMTGREDYERCARRLIAAFQPKLVSAPYGLTQMLAACEFDLALPREIVVAGDIDPAIRHLLWKNFDPNRVLMRASAELALFQPAVAHMSAPQGKTAVFLCENFTCNAPVTDAADLARLLE